MIMLWRALVLSFAVLVSFSVQTDAVPETPVLVPTENEKAPHTMDTCDSADQEMMEMMEMTEFLEMMELLEDMELLDDFDALVKED